MSNSTVYPEPKVETPLMKPTVNSVTSSGSITSIPSPTSPIKRKNVSSSSHEVSPSAVSPVIEQPLTNDNTTNVQSPNPQSHAVSWIIGILALLAIIGGAFVGMRKK